MTPQARHAALGFLLCLVLLTAFGLLTGLSVSAPGSAWSQLGLHCLHLALGLTVFLACLAFPVDQVRKVAPGMILLVGAVLVAMLFGLFGHESHNAVRWIRIGPMSWQPSTFLQCLWPVVLAHWAARSPVRLQQPWQLAKLFLAFALLMVPVLMQPDLGSVLILFTVSSITLLFAGAPVSYLRVLIPLGLGVLLLAIQLFPHVESRVTAFVNHTPDFQQVRAEEAFALGGIWGRGPGMGVMKYGAVPEGETDYVLALVAEEWGMIGTVMLWGLYVALTLFGIRLAQHAESRYGAILMASATLMLSVQAALNMAVVTGAVPPKGLPLPFVSRGGSSILALSALLGLALRAALEKRRAQTSVEEWIPWTKSSALAS